MDLKKLLKSIKLHEQELSIMIGILLLVVSGVFVIRYVKNLQTQKQITDNSAATQNINQGQKYTVKKGDTLWSISQKFYNSGNEWKKIALANEIINPSKLKEGTSLIIPSVTATPSTNPTNNTKPTPNPQITNEAASTSSQINGASYTVVKGDNLWKIALRAYGDGFKWVEIAKANHLKNPSLIHSGNVFIIPR